MIFLCLNSVFKILKTSKGCYTESEIESLIEQKKVSKNFSMSQGNSSDPLMKEELDQIHRSKKKVR